MILLIFKLYKYWSEKIKADFYFLLKKLHITQKTKFKYGTGLVDL